MIALVLASLIGFAHAPARVTIVAPSAAPANTPSAAPAASPAAANAIVIRNSGSTNTLGYTIAVSPDGAALVTQNGPATQKSLSTDMTRELFDDVHALMPLDAGGLRPCMRSVSFGSSTTVSYQNATTPDLSCRGDAASAQLRQTIARVAQALGVTTLWRHRLQQ